MKTLWNRVKKFVEGTFVLIYGALGALLAIFVLVGAFRCVNAFFTGAAIDFLESLGLGVAMLIAGIVATVWFVIDTEE